MNDQLRYSKWSLASAIENLRWNPFLLPSIKFSQASPWSKWTNKETLPQPLGTLEEVDQSLVYKHWEFCNGDTLSNSSYPSLLESHFLQIVVKKSQLTWSCLFYIHFTHYTMDVTLHPQVDGFIYDEDNMQNLSTFHKSMLVVRHHFSNYLLKLVCHI